MPGSAPVRCATTCAQSSPTFYWKEVPGQVVFGVVVLCVLLLLLQHQALKKKSDAPS